jgi:hypothetical protein
VRALNTRPFARTNEDFAVPIAFLTVKFVNRHGIILIDGVQIGKVESRTGFLEIAATFNGSRKPGYFTPAITSGD